MRSFIFFLGLHYIVIHVSMANGESLPFVSVFALIVTGIICGLQDVKELRR